MIVDKIPSHNFVHTLHNNMKIKNPGAKKLHTLYNNTNINKKDHCQNAQSYICT